MCGSFPKYHKYSPKLFCPFDRPLYSELFLYMAVNFFHHYYSNHLHYLGSNNGFDTDLFLHFFRLLR
jgi:hypothetical protein